VSPDGLPAPIPMTDPARILRYLLCAAACAATIAAPGAAAQVVDPRGVDPASPNPLVGVQWFVDRTWAPQYEQYQRYVRRGQGGKAALIGKVALQPQFKWFGRWNEDDKGGTYGAARSYVERVQEEQPGSVPQIVVMRHQGKACHSRYTAGGAAEDARTRRWYDELARGIGDARVVIGFEPDSLGTVQCLARHRRRARLDTLRYGVDVLSQLPNATIYLEAGASDWEPASRTANQLRYIGIAKVRGFMLNVTHKDWTAANVQHGLQISRWTGGKHFVVNTSENGRGPVHYRRWISRGDPKLWRRVNVWCHPLKRGLGIPPTTVTLRPDKADAYLYIGRPGYSGGSCNGGPLPIGSWFERRALDLARHATTWVRQPRGYVNGWPRGSYTARQLAGDQYIP
jgi:endoglucanase